jgi:histone H3/H4
MLTSSNSHHKILCHTHQEGLMSQVLVVASKVKQLIKDQAGMNTSANVMDALTKVVEREILKAVERAKNDGRKTVMDRDFE